MSKAALLCVFVLLFSVLASIGWVAFRRVGANFVPGIPFIYVISPANKTYNTDLIPLNISISTFFDFGRGPRIVEYSLDGKENVTISTEYQGLDENYYSTVTGFAQLPALSEGTHTITVYATYQFPDYSGYTTSDSKTVTFTIDFASPCVTILSPRNYGRYNTTDVALIFTVDKPFLTLSYCLDGGLNIFVEGNTTLSGLSVGLHKLVVYATSVEGITGISETVSFEIVEEVVLPASSSPLLTPSFSLEGEPTVAPSLTSTAAATSETSTATVAIVAFAAFAAFAACLVMFRFLRERYKSRVS